MAKKENKITLQFLGTLWLTTEILKASGQTYYHSKGFAFQDHAYASYTAFGNLSLSKCSFQCLVNQCILVKLEGSSCFLAYIGGDASATWVNSKAIQQLVQLVYTNLALGKPTWSSTPASGSSQLTVDNIRTANSGYASASNASAWIMIDLQMPYYINKIKLWCPFYTYFDYLKVYTSVDNAKPNSWSNMTFSFSTGINATQGNTNWTNMYHNYVPFMARYIMVVKNAGYYLVLDELQVFGYEKV